MIELEASRTDMKELLLDVLKREIDDCVCPDPTATNCASKFGSCGKCCIVELGQYGPSNKSKCEDCGRVCSQIAKLLKKRGVL